MIGGEELKISGIVGENESAPKPNRCGYYQGIDRQFAVPTCHR